DAGYPADRADQIREVELAVMIRVHGLPEQHDLGHAFADDLVHLADDVCQTTTTLGTARGWDDAVRASIVASPLDGDPRFDSVEAPRLKVLVMLLEIERRGDRALAAPRAVDERRQRAIAVGSDHDAHVARLLQQLRSETLRHASGDADDRARLHVAFEL